MNGNNKIILNDSLYDSSSCLGKLMSALLQQVRKIIPGMICVGLPGVSVPCVGCVACPLRCGKAGVDTTL